ncbi:transposase [Bernardetia litoralis DSM 6794]|uniref:Transposase n=1 Tax=Bernardetia litoralis (strain ATCC 23117 / DSM 6794 / NBRC 15988 / NCIMB 1366 / Fx l1 / Sio-4) TaxID=880071 RepID=I4AFS8_BERLS|nr:transposase [Bernardetia litoralis]AFM02813.1 transposase [Bernardetia litoralis DSM 6794]
MSEYRKTYEGGLFFITLTVVGWIDVFTRKEYADILVESLEFCKKEKQLAIFAYVIMPSHIHLIVRRNEGLLSDWLRDFKSYTAKQIIKEIENGGFESRKEWLLHLFKYHAKFKAQNSKYMFWQKSNHPTDLFIEKVTHQKIDYIHHNPVAANIVTEESYYHYSSTNPLSPLKMNE